ncbi:hypothetical protein CAPTEDRAFT_98109, partial [Capitella teleta]
IHDIPPWYPTVLFGYKHYLTMFGRIFALPLLMAPALCVGNNFLVTAELLGTMLFMSGLVTMLQSSIGIRLPIVQGGAFSFLVPTCAILNSPQFRCLTITGQTFCSRELQ